MQPVNRLTYQDLGKGPAVVFLHDSLLTPDCWQRQINPLVKSGFRLILPDLSSGHGNGQLTTYSNGVIDLLNRLGLGRVVICGMGLGGAIAFDLLERHQNRFAGACFIATRPVPDDIHEKARRAEVISDLQTEDGWPVREDLLKMLFGGRENRLSDATQMTIRRMVHSHDRKSIICSLKAMAERKDYTSLLNKLQLPTMVIGAEHDLICHPGHTQIMAGRLPNCFRAVSLDAGHLLQYEQAEAFNRQILDFLAAIVPRRCRIPASCARKAA